MFFEVRTAVGLSLISCLMACQTKPILLESSMPSRIRTIVGKQQIVKDFQIHKAWARATTQSTDLSFRKGSRMTPILTSDKVIEGNTYDGVAAYSRASGNLLWHFPVAGGVEGGMAQVKDLLFFGGNDGNFYCISLSKGEEKWNFQTKSETLSSPLLADGTLYFVTGNNVLFALDASTGKQLWIYSRVDSQALSIRGSSSPTLSKGILFIGFGDGSLVALNAKTGTVKWERTLNKNKKFRDLDSTPLVDDEWVYILGYDASLYSLKAESGALGWHIEPGGFGPITMLGDQIFYASSGGEILAVNKKSGRIQWRNKIKDGIASSLIPYQDFLVYVETQGGLQFIRPLDGVNAGTFFPGVGSASPPAVDSKLSEIYFMSAENNLYKIETLWKNINEGLPWLRTE